MDSWVISRLVLCKNWIFHTKIDEICVLVGLLKIIIKFTILIMIIIAAEGSPGDSEGKESVCNAGLTLKMKVKSLSHIWLFATLWTVTHQTPLFMGISRQEYWSGLPFPSSGDLPNPVIKFRSPTLWADSLLSWVTRESWYYVLGNILGWPKSLFRLFPLHSMEKSERTFGPTVYI